MAALADEPGDQPASAPWPGAKVVPLLASVAIGLALRFLVPVPAGVTLQAWTLLAVFVSTIAGASHVRRARGRRMFKQAEGPWSSSLRQLCVCGAVNLALRFLVPCPGRCVAGLDAAGCIRVH